MLYLGCAITVIIEEVFFRFTEYAKKEHFAVLCAAVNIATNLTLNMVLGLYRTAASAGLSTWLAGSAGISMNNAARLQTALAILLLEALVVIVEYAVYAAAYGRSKKLFLLTAGTNAASFLTGIILFGLPF